MHRHRQLAPDGQERTVRRALLAANVDARSYNNSNLLLYSCSLNQLELQTHAICVTMNLPTCLFSTERYLRNYIPVLSAFHKVN